MSELDKKLDAIYDKIDDMLLDGDFQGVDEILLHLNVEELSSEELICYLTVTLPAAKFLKKRKQLVYKAYKEFTKRGEADDLLNGLIVEK